MPARWLDGADSAEGLVAVAARMDTTPLGHVIGSNVTRREGAENDPK